MRLPSPAMIVALISLVVALGGTSYAVVKLPKSSVGTKQLKNKSVTTAKVRSNAINSAKVKDRSLLGRDFKKGQLPAGPAGPPGPSNAYFSRQTGTATLASPSATALLASFALPAGSYTFTAQAFAFRQASNGNPDQIMCSLVNGNAAFAGLPSQTTIDPSANLNFVGAVTLDAPTTVELSCFQVTQPLDAADTLGVIGGRVLATRVGELAITP